MKLSIQYPELAPPAVAQEAVKLADDLGYDTAWVTESYGFDCMSTLGYLAAATTRIKLATGIANVYSRSPALLAQSAATIDALSGGRFVLGVGSSGRAVVAGWHGVPFDRPLARLRESVEIIRMVLRGERLIHEGEVFDVRSGIKLLRRPLRADVPVYLATIGPRGLALAGEIADGALPVHVSLRHIELFSEPVAAGVAAAGRDPGSCRLCAFGVPVIPTDDVDAARERQRVRIALYVGGMGTREQNFYKELFVRYGYAREAEQIQELFLERRRDEAAAAVTDAMVDDVAVIGSVAECRARLDEYGQAGIDELVMLLDVPEDDPERVFAALEGLAPTGP